MLKLYFVWNGGRRVFLGWFDQMEETIAALKEHQRSHSAIAKPRFAKSLSGDVIRIDYGAKDCFYVIERG